jgi:hypothetical protein
MEAEYLQLAAAGMRVFSTLGSDQGSLYCSLEIAKE